MNGTVRRTSDGGLVWRAEGAVALGPVSFAAKGITVSVDAASPTEVIEIAVGGADTLRSAASIFGDTASIEPIVDAAVGDVVEGPLLSDDLVRMATVAAVDAIHLGDLDDGVLALDAAYAGAVLGDPSSEWLYALAASVPGRLVDEIDSADYHGPLVDRLSNAIMAGPHDVFGVVERTEMIDTLRSRTDHTDVLWQILVTDVDLPAAELAVDLGGFSSAVVYLADLRPLPPRVLTFTGPEQPEVEVTLGSAGGMDVTARIRSDVDADALVAEGIFAVVAESATGAVLAFAPATVVDGRMIAHLAAVDGLGIDDMRCAFLGSGADLSALRLDPLGVALTRVDRYCRHAWTRHRIAGAVRAGLGIAASDLEIARAARIADAAHAEAGDAMGHAQALIRQLARRHGAATMGDHRAAVDRLAESVAEPPATDGPAGPTMAELHAIGLP
ncbi:hypothetical protein [Gordonia sp. NPDC003376]